MNLKPAMLFLDFSTLVNASNGDNLDVDTAILPFVDKLRLFCEQNELFFCCTSINCNVLAHCAAN